MVFEKFRKKWIWLVWTHSPVLSENETVNLIGAYPDLPKRKIVTISIENYLVPPKTRKSGNFDRNLSRSSKKEKHWQLLSEPILILPKRKILIILIGINLDSSKKENGGTVTSTHQIHINSNIFTKIRCISIVQV